MTSSGDRKGSRFLADSSGVGRWCRASVVQCSRANGLLECTGEANPLKFFVAATFPPVIWIDEIVGHGKQGLEHLVGMGFGPIAERNGLDRSGSALMILAMAAVACDAVLLGILASLDTPVMALDEGKDILVPVLAKGRYRLRSGQIPDGRWSWPGDQKCCVSHVKCPLNHRGRSVSCEV